MAIPLPPLNLNMRDDASAISGSGTFTIGGITTEGPGLELRFLPWYAWAAVAVVGLAIIVRKGQ